MTRSLTDRVFIGTPGLRIVLATIIGLLALPSLAQATSAGFDSGSISIISDGVDGADLEISSPATGTVRIVEFSLDDDLTAGTNCTEPAPDTVECSGVGSSPILYYYGSDNAESVDVQDSVGFRVELYGYGGGDVLLGGAGNDRLGGGPGADDLDGRDGNDLIDNGYDSYVVPTADDGPDTYRDTGVSGTDYLNYGPQTVGVKISLDGLPNDGAEGEGDNVLAGFEGLRGTAFDDTISGGGDPEQINGSDGDDTISGGGGADRLEGNRGDDVIDAVDGIADVYVYCDSPSDPPPAGAADVAYVDLADPAPGGCETVDDSKTPSGPVLGPPTETAAVSRMPRVTGKAFVSARNQVVRAIPNVEIDLDFRRGCKAGSDLEIVKQAPRTGASLPNNARDPVEVKLTTCLAERDFLRDCDLKSLRGDLRELPRAALDAEVGLALAKTVSRCKVDYDIKLKKAADEARIELEAQRTSKKKKKKGELNVELDCPVPGDLRLAVADGYTPDRRALGLRASGSGGWTLPAGFRSFVELTVLDRAIHFPEATVYTDADQVSHLRPPPKKTTNGRVQVALDPFKGAGKVTICVVQPTGGDEVLTGAVEIKVVPRPSNGTIWETTSGRRLKITGDGPVLATAAASGLPASGGLSKNQRLEMTKYLPALSGDVAPAVTSAAGLSEIWDLLVGLFSGTSRSIAEAPAGSASEKRLALVDAYRGPKYGAAQVSLTGKLSANPAAPVIADGPCASIDGNGTIRPLTCSQLQTTGGTAMIGTRLGGNALVAAGGGNIVAAGGGNIVAAGGGNLIGLDGATLIGLDGASIVAAGGGNIVAAGGGNAISIAPAGLVAAGGGNLIGADGASLVAAGGLN